MSQEIKFIDGIFQAGDVMIKTKIGCRVTCDGTLNTISLHTDKTIMSVPLKEVKGIISKAERS
jgi:hypothetical protein